MVGSQPANSSSTGPKHIPLDWEQNFENQSQSRINSALSRRASSVSPRKRLSRSIGLLNLCIIVSGTFFSAGVMCFLLYFWVVAASTSNGQNAPQTWRVFVNNGWLLQTITLSTLALRLCLAVPVSLCTSMVAGLILERRSMPLARAASMSVHRSVNGGPLGFFEQFLHRNMCHLLFHSEVLIMLLLALCSLGLQFSSTLLLTDIDSRPVVGFSQSVNYSLFTSSDPYVYAPYPMFGLERTAESISVVGESESGYVAAPSKAGVSDTGLRRRAMLPLSNDRTSIHDIRGPALVMDSRAACMPPVMRGELSVSPSSPWGFEWDLLGVIDYEETERQAGTVGYSEFCSSVDKYCPKNVNCTLAAYGATTCVLDIAGSLSYPWSDSAPWHAGLHPWQNAPYVMLVANRLDGHMINETVGLQSRGTSGEWHMFKPPGPSGHFLNVSLCFYNYNVTLSGVHLIAESDLHEPDLTLMPNSNTDSDQFGTGDDDIRDYSGLDAAARSLGADPSYQAPRDRGILTIHAVQNMANTTEAVEAGAGLHYQVDSSFLGPDDGALPVLSLCEIDCSTIAYEYLEMIDSLVQKYQRPAVAIQTLMAMITQYAHDQLLKYADRPFAAEVEQLKTREVPVAFMGYSIVLALFLVVTMCMILITTLYARKARFSMLDNFWHAVAQLSGPATAVWLGCEADDGLMLDEEVERMLGDETAGRLVRLGSVDPSGRVGLVPVDEDDVREGWDEFEIGGRT